ncbi:hypothetical protein [Thiofaba sp. EF100]|uniref:hypothetical protein n=1 Tax=Thiofaba sp. EF100 TaxID=3121274 RepID=UPI003221D552
MAAKKDNQPARVELPEKEWFSLEEIAERWGCSVDDLLHYGETDVIRICAKTRNMQFVRGRIQNGHFIDSSEPEKIAGIIAVPPPIIGEIADGKPITEGIWAELKKEKIGDEAANPTSWFWIDSMDAVGLKSLVITREERDRFEREYRLGAYAGTMPSKAEMEDRLDPRKEKTYLQMIRVLLKAAGLPREPYSAAHELQAKAAKYGLSLPSKDETIAEKIKAAITLED